MKCYNKLCGTVFEKQYYNQKYCSRSCSNKVRCKKHHKKYRDEILLRKKVNYLINNEKMLYERNKYKETNRTKCRTYDKEYYQKNKKELSVLDRIRKKTKIYIPIKFVREDYDYWNMFSLRL